MSSTSLLTGDLSQYLPHGDALCLIDRIVSQSASELVCETNSHCRTMHPLRSTAGSLDAVMAIEYAAQATALHAASLSGDTVAPKFIGSLRGVRWQNVALSDLADALRIRVVLQAHNDTGAIYNFYVSHIDTSIMDGRIALLQRRED